mgnify:CR=1 FL=1
MSKRPARFTREQIMSDDELFESVGQFILAHEIDNNYAYLRHKNLSHEEATIKSRQMAGLDVKDDSPVAAQNAADAALVQRYKNAIEARKVPDLEKENMRMAGQVKGMMNYIDKLEIKYGELLDQTGMPGDVSSLEKLYRDTESARKTLLDRNALLEQDLRRANADAEFGSKKHSKRLAGVVLAALAGGAGTNEIIEYLQGPTIEETEYYR